MLNKCVASNSWRSERKFTSGRPFREVAAARCVFVCVCVRVCARAAGSKASGKENKKEVGESRHPPILPN